MKDAAHHLKHVQRKVIQGARREKAIKADRFSRSQELNGKGEEVTQEMFIAPSFKNERLPGHPNYH